MPDTVKSLYVAHFIINVSDFEISKSFYDQLMNQLGAISPRIVTDSEACRICAYDIPGCPFYIRWARDEEKQAFVRNVGLDHLCFGVEGKEDVDSAFETVTALGTKITISPKSYPDYTDNYYAFYFRDPDGFPLEVAFI